MTYRPGHTGINAWRSRVRLEARTDNSGYGASAHGLVDDFVSSNKHPKFFHAFEVLSALDRAIVFAWGPGNQKRTNTLNLICHYCNSGNFLFKNNFP